MDLQDRVWKKVRFYDVEINDHFWKSRIDKLRNVSLHAQYQMLRKYGAIANFSNVINGNSGKYYGLFFSDADVYKWIEAACYSIKNHPDSKLEKCIQKITRLIQKTQQPDGYINTYFQLMEPDKKFTNFGACHELYTAGHLIQAGIANFSATGKKTLLQVAVQCTDHIDSIIGPGKLEAVDGHAGIEMALVDLHHLTGEIRYLNLAQFFIDKRGDSDSRLKWECGHLDEIAGEYGKPGKNNLKYYNSYKQYDGRYAQDHLPVRKQTKVVGHAVRAMYLYCGMADLAAVTGEKELIIALERLWEHLTTKRMYITGGIGATRANEGFTQDYDLPNDTVCAETCAAVGMILWNHRLLNLTKNKRYADILEKVLYNAFLVSISLDGKKYFYNNPLKSNGTEHRYRWYECFCCPPNAARILSTIGNYIYSYSGNELVVHLFIQSKVQVRINGDDVILIQSTDYPWDGKIQLAFKQKKPVFFSLYIRIPDWCLRYTLLLNNEKIALSVKDGYIEIERLWQSNDTLFLDLDMPVFQVTAHPSVKQNFGKIALQRGPLVYCLEQVDHGNPVDQITVPSRMKMKYRCIPDLLDGVVVIEGNAYIPDYKTWNNSLYQRWNVRKLYKEILFKAVPYYAWDNRAPGSMVVWINGSA
jgi:DUF1680 family protein